MKHTARHTSVNGSSEAASGANGVTENRQHESAQSSGGRMQNQRFSGVHSIMPTPFTDTGALDLASMETLTSFLIERGVDGLVVLGTLGEAPKLDEAEQERVLSAVVAAAASRVPVFAGCAAAGSDLAARRGARFIELGASGLLVTPPPVQSDTVILEYYRCVHDATDKPIVVQDYPASTDILLAPALISQLHDEMPRIAAIKLEHQPTGSKITALRKLGSDISILGGLGAQYYYEELERGSDGMMSGFSYPEILVAIQRAYDAGDSKTAREIFYRACPLIRYEFQPGIGLALRKEIYRRRGAIASGFVRHPGQQIDPALIKELDQILEFLTATGLLS